LPFVRLGAGSQLLWDRKMTENGCVNKPDSVIKL